MARSLSSGAAGTLEVWQVAVLRFRIGGLGAFFDDDLERSPAVFVE